MSENNTLPSLTLTPESVRAEASQSLNTAMQAAPKAAQPHAVPVANEATGAAAAVAAVEEMPQLKDHFHLTPEEQRVIDDFAGKIDVSNADHVLLFGADAQKKIADFSDSALATVRTNDTGVVGDMLTQLVGEIRGFGSAAEKPRGLRAIGWNAKRAMNEMTVKYDKVEANVDTIATELEKHQVQLLKDISLFDQLYDMNKDYLKELTMYIMAGEKRLEDIRSGQLKKLREAAAASGDALDAQTANDLAADCDRFEKKLHDLKLTRQVALQTAPQIRLLQNNDSMLVERIQSTLSNTLPLWKNQILIALGMHRSQEALKAQRSVTDMTNELLRKNAEALKMGTISTAQEAERGIIDLETITATNQSLIDTINEVMRIQTDGRAKRMEAERQMLQMESDLRKKLLEIRN